MSNHPRDEFDRVPESSARQGVHRARLEAPANRGIALLIIAGAAVLLIGVLAYVLMPDDGKSGQSATGTAGASQAEAAGDASRAAGETSRPDAAEAGDETAAGTPEATARATATPASPSPSPTPTPSETSSIDKSTGVVVLNNTGVPGLAGSVTSRLSVDGWAVTFTGNWAGRTQPSSVIFYDGAEQLANAQALAAQLGIARLVDTPTLGQPLTVVLGPGFGLNSVP